MCLFDEGRSAGNGTSRRTPGSVAGWGGDLVQKQRARWGNLIRETIWGKSANDQCDVRRWTKRVAAHSIKRWQEWSLDRRLELHISGRSDACEGTGPRKWHEGSEDCTLGARAIFRRLLQSSDEPGNQAHGAAPELVCMPRRLWARRCLSPPNDPTVIEENRLVSNKSGTREAARGVYS